MDEVCYTFIISQFTDNHTETLIDILVNQAMNKIRNKFQSFKFKANRIEMFVIQASFFNMYKRLSNLIPMIKG